MNGTYWRIFFYKAAESLVIKEPSSSRLQNSCDIFLARLGAICSTYKHSSDWIFRQKAADFRKVSVAECTCNPGENATTRSPMKKMRFFQSHQMPYSTHHFTLWESNIKHKSNRVHTICCVIHMVGMCIECCEAKTCGRPQKLTKVNSNTTSEHLCWCCFSFFL